MKAINYAREKGCQVISLSLGGLRLNHWGSLLRVAINEAILHDVVVVAAAGQNIPGRETVLPAGFPNVIGVSGIQNKGGETGYWPDASRVPAGSVTISAPAHRNYADRYEVSWGTSYATAFVAGIAALWMSHHFPRGYEGSRPAQFRFREHIKATTRQPDRYYVGYINAEGLRATPPPAEVSSEGEGVDDSTPVSEFARLVGMDDVELAERLLRETIPEEPGPLAGWSEEIGTLLYADADLRGKVAKAVSTPSANAADLVAVLSPRASEALRARFDVANRRRGSPGRC
ncbi:MAG: S8/S53 family peptidase [Verrucomicrobiota bacterium]